MTNRHLIVPFAAVGLAAALVACGGGNSGDTGGGTTTSTGGTGGGSSLSCPTPADTTGCSTVVMHGDGDDDKVQAALINVDSGGTVCLCPGTYSFTKQLTLTKPNVTVKGVGAAIEDTILDFSGDTGMASGNDTMLVTADGFTIENMWVKNTPGNGVVVRQSDKPTFRKLKVSWDSPVASSHGAYAIYPAECSNVLVEDSEVFGAADAAIYVGQGTGAIIRRNKAHDSVLGIELENTSNGEVYDNEAYNNSGGLAVFLLGNLNKKTANDNLVHDNNVHDNNHVNFGDPKTVVSKVPVGTGIIVVGADDTELRNNTITNNESAAILVVNYKLMVALVPGAMLDPATDPNPERTFIHDNTFMMNGAMPQDPLTIIGVTPLENVLWDGITKSGGDPAASNEAQFCVGSKAPYPTFRMFDGTHLSDPTNAKQSTDTTPYQCDLPALPSSSN